MTMKRDLLAVCAALLVGVTCHTPSSAADTANHNLGEPPLTLGSRGPDVAALQWLLSGHKPYAFTSIKPYLTTYDKGVSGGADSRTWKAVRAMKFRLGYPGKNQCTAKTIVPAGVHWFSNTVGPYFFSLLLGHKQRPACWVALSAKRIQQALEGASPKAIELKKYELTKVGIAEPQAYSIFNAYFHLPPEAWCAIFQGYSMVHVNLPLLAAQNPWYVPDIITWGRYNGKLRAAAKIGEMVLYYGDISHIGYVINTDPKTGGYTTVEGNWNNRVAVVQHPAFDHLHYFLAVPGAS